MRVSVFVIFLLPLLFVGCATDTQRNEQVQKVRNGDFILSTADALPGSIYDLRIYTIAKGDTLARIAERFQISLIDLEAINPGLVPTRLLIGQKIRVYEKKSE